MDNFSAVAIFEWREKATSIEVVINEVINVDSIESPVAKLIELFGIILGRMVLTSG